MAFPLSYVNGKNVADILTNDVAVDLNGDTFKAALYANDVTAWDSTTAEYYGEATTWTTAAEITGTGYTAGGASVGTCSCTVSAGKFVHDGDAQTVWNTATFTTRGTIVYDDTLTTTGKRVLAAINFGGDLAPSADTFTITWDATNGIWYATFGTGS